MPPPARSAKTEAFYDLIEVKKAKFNSCVISAGITELKKAILIYVLSHASYLWGSFPPASPSR